MVDSAPHVRRGHPIIFGLLAFFALIEGCITAWLVSNYNSNNNSPSSKANGSVRFLLFTSWWTVVFTILYLVFFLTDMFAFFTSIASHAVWLFLTWLFWLAGTAALTDALGGGQNCSNSGLIYCSQNMAAIAFGWIEFIIITVAFVVVVLLGTAALRRGDRLSGGLIV